MVLLKGKNGMLNLKVGQDIWQSTSVPSKPVKSITATHTPNTAPSLEMLLNAYNLSASKPPGLKLKLIKAYVARNLFTHAHELVDLENKRHVTTMLSGMSPRVSFSIQECLDLAANIPRDMYVYNVLMHCCVRRKEYAKLHVIFTELCKNHVPDNYTFRMLEPLDLDWVKKVFEGPGKDFRDHVLHLGYQFGRHPLQTGLKARVEVLLSAAKSEKEHSITPIDKQPGSLDIPLDPVSEYRLLRLQLVRLLSRNQLSAARSLLFKAEQKRIHTRKLYCILLAHYAKRAQIENVLLTLRRMSLNSIQPSSDEFSFLMMACLKCKYEFRDIWRVYSSIVRAGMVPTINVFQWVLIASSREEFPNSGFLESIIDDISRLSAPLTPKFYNETILALVQSGKVTEVNIQGAILLLEEMLKRKVYPQLQVFEQLMAACVADGCDSKCIDQLLPIVMDSAPKEAAVLLFALAQKLVEHNRAIHPFLLREINSASSDNFKLVSKLMVSFGAQNKPQLVLQAVADLLPYGPDPALFTLMIEQVGIVCRSPLVNQLYGMVPTELVPITEEAAWMYCKSLCAVGDVKAALKYSMAGLLDSGVVLKGLFLPLFSEWLNNQGLVGELLVFKTFWMDRGVSI